MNQNIFQKIHFFILDTLFPIRCFFCSQNNSWICEKCLEKIRLLENQVCPFCEKEISPLGKICPRCQQFFLKSNNIIPLDNMIVAAKYQEKNISNLIHILKYRFISELSEPLGKILIKSILKNNLPLPDLIVPVPLHKRRLRWRGFNQAELLAQFVSRNLIPGFEIPVMPNAILRKKYTLPQMKLKNYQQRRKNIQNIFMINKNVISNIEDKKILLIDDVATTGSTLFECGRALRMSGVRKVYACVIARQE